MEIVNIDLLTTMLLEPQQPQITSASLTVGKRHLLYGRGVVDTLPELKKMKSVTSFHRDISFTISVSGPSAGVLAFKHLPTQLPLAVLLSLLIGYIARLATASRMSFSSGN